MAVVGRRAELCYLMHTRQVKITGVSEARCSGSAVFRSGDYLILQSGGPHPCSAGVAFILHAEIVRSLHSLTPYSARMAMVTLKIVGGLLTIIVVYLPYEVYLPSAAAPTFSPPARGRLAGRDLERLSVREASRVLAAKTAHGASARPQLRTDKPPRATGAPEAGRRWLALVFLS